MLTRQWLRKVCSIFLVFFFLIRELGFAASVSMPQNEWGYHRFVATESSVQFVSGKSFGSSPISLVLIEDAHSSLSTQLKTVSFLETLTTLGGMEVVGVEGGMGPSDVSWLQSFPDAQIRKETTLRLLESGQISSADYFKIVSKAAVDVFGVENRSLYQEQLKDFKSLLLHRNGTEKILSQAEARFWQLKRKLYPPLLLNWEEIKSEILLRSAEAIGHLYQIQNMVHELNLDLSHYPHLGRLIRLATAEQGLSLEVVEDQRHGLFEQLKKSLSPAEYETLLAQFGASADSPEKIKEFYESLVSQLVRLHLDLRPYSNFIRHLDHSRKMSDFDLNELRNEVMALDFEFRSKLLISGEQKKLARMDRQFQRLKNKMQGTLSADERFFDGKDREVSLEEIFSSLRSLAGQYQVQQLPENAGLELVPVWQHAQRFYRQSDLREREMLDQLVSFLKVRKKNQGVLIVGGFHTPGLVNELIKRRVSHQVYRPKWIKDDQFRSYVSVLLEKNAFLDYETRSRALFEAIADMFGQGILKGYQLPILKEAYLNQGGVERKLKPSESQNEESLSTRSFKGIRENNEIDGGGKVQDRSLAAGSIASAWDKSVSPVSIRSFVRTLRVKDRGLTASRLPFIVLATSFGDRFVSINANQSSSISYYERNESRLGNWKKSVCSWLLFSILFLAASSIESFAKGLGKGALDLSHSNRANIEQSAGVSKAKRSFVPKALKGAEALSLLSKRNFDESKGLFSRIIPKKSEKKQGSHPVVMVAMNSESSAPVLGVLPPSPEKIAQPSSASYVDAKSSESHSPTKVAERESKADSSRFSHTEESKKAAASSIPNLGTCPLCNDPQHARNLRSLSGNGAIGKIASDYEKFADPLEILKDRNQTWQHRYAALMQMTIEKNPSAKGFVRGMLRFRPSKAQTKLVEAVDTRLSVERQMFPIEMRKNITSASTAPMTELERSLNPFEGRIGMDVQGGALLRYLKESWQQVRSLQNENDPLLGAAAAVYLGTVEKDWHDVEVLVKWGLEHPDPLVRSMSAWALGQTPSVEYLGKVRGVDALIAHSLTDLDPFVRYYAIRTMTAIADSDSRIVMAMKRVLEIEKDYYAISAAVDYAMQYPRDQFNESLFEILKWKAPEDNPFLAHEYLILKQKVRTAIKRFYDQNPVFQEGVINALTKVFEQRNVYTMKTGIRDSLPHFTALLESLWAGEMSQEMRDLLLNRGLFPRTALSEASPELEKIVQDIQAALQALEKQLALERAGEYEAFHELAGIQHENQSHPERRVDSAYLAWLINLPDVDPGFRRLAVYSLGQALSIEAEKEIIDSLQDPNSAYVEAALQALWKINIHKTRLGVQVFYARQNAFLIEKLQRLALSAKSDISIRPVVEPVLSYRVRTLALGLMGHLNPEAYLQTLNTLGSQHWVDPRILETSLELLSTYGANHLEAALEFVLEVQAEYSLIDEKIFLSADNSFFDLAAKIKDPRIIEASVRSILTQRWKLLTEEEVRIFWKPSLKAWVQQDLITTSFYERWSKKLQQFEPIPKRVEVETSKPVDQNPSLKSDVSGSPKVGVLGPTQPAMEVDQRTTNLANSPAGLATSKAPTTNWRTPSSALQMQPVPESGRVMSSNAVLVPGKNIIKSKNPVDCDDPFCESSAIGNVMVPKSSQGGRREERLPALWPSDSFRLVISGKGKSIIDAMNLISQAKEILRLAVRSDLKAAFLDFDGIFPNEEAFNDVIGARDISYWSFVSLDRLARSNEQALPFPEKNILWMQGENALEVLMRLIHLNIISLQRTPRVSWQREVPERFFSFSSESETDRLIRELPLLQVFELEAMRHSLEGFAVAHPQILMRKDSRQAKTINLWVTPNLMKSDMFFSRQLDLLKAAGYRLKLSLVVRGDQQEALRERQWLMEQGYLSNHSIQNVFALPSRGRMDLKVLFTHDPLAHPAEEEAIHIIGKEEFLPWVPPYSHVSLINFERTEVQSGWLLLQAIQQSKPGQARLLRPQEISYEQIFAQLRSSGLIHRSA